MLSYTTERPVTIYRIEIICRRYKSTLKRSTQAIWYHSAKESQATHSQEPICLLPFNHLLIIFVIVVFCELWLFAVACRVNIWHVSCSVSNCFDVLVVWQPLSLPLSCYYLYSGGGRRLGRFLCQNHPTKSDVTSGWKLSWTLVSLETKDGGSTRNIFFYILNWQLPKLYTITV